ncbi:hypothetical protein [Segatella maculosa]|uniref:hypothetical protein n=1 Tax=Segatella maculosa TaxID=439703 RepID=UPI0028D03997|nr:hypothetical protein [Segatella maculosa]
MAGNSKWIEGEAVDFIKTEIRKSKRMFPYIDDNDRTPSWDGNIFLYSNSSGEKSNLLGKIPVQVKGHNIKSFPKGNIKYRAEMADLRNFYNDKGVLFFVVCLRELEARGFEKKGYYTCLPIAKLKKMLEKGRGQTKTTIELSPMPDKIKELENSLFTFYDDLGKQVGVRYAKELPSIQDLTDEQLGRQFEFTVIVENNKNPWNQITSSYRYLYAKTANGILPFKEGPCKLAFMTEREANIRIGERVYYKMAKVKYQSGKTSIIVGDSIEIFLDEEGCIGNIQINLTQSFRHRLVDLDFLLEAYHAKHFLFNNTKIDFVLSNGVIKEREKKEHLEVLKKIKILFDTLHITKDLQLNKLKARDWDLLELLHGCLLYHKPYITKKKMEILCQTKIQDICILLLATEIQRENGRYHYRLKDFFEEIVAFACETNNGKTYPASVFVAMTQERYCTCSNINWGQQIPLFKEMIKDNPETFNLANMSVLQMLAAYDRTKNKELISRAEELQDWLMKETHCDLPCDLMTINKCQIIKRNRDFTEKEQLEIRDVINKTEDESLKFACYLLLGEKTAAKYHYARVDEQTKVNLKNWPIMRFARDLNLEI